MARMVTGFIPIPDHPRPAAVYAEKGQELVKKVVELTGEHVACGHMNIEDCWLYEFLHQRGHPATHSVADNPKKNTMAYHIVQHQKLEFLMSAASYFTDKVLAWVDYGILTVPGVTPEIVADFLKRADDERAIAVPGCWRKPPVEIDDSQPCWRFCGGVFVVPRAHLLQLNATFQACAMERINETNNVTWEVNTWARVEQRWKLPIWWYEADHNQTMFTGYQTPRGMI